MLQHEGEREKCALLKSLQDFNCLREKDREVKDRYIRDQGSWVPCCLHPLCPGSWGTMLGAVQEPPFLGQMKLCSASTP